MTRVTIKNLFDKTIAIEDHTKSLLKHFHENGIDWMHACGARGRCTTCRLMVVEGSEVFEPLTDPELRYQSIGALLPGERLACQARLREAAPGTPVHVVVRVPRDTQLPHLRYSDRENA